MLTRPRISSSAVFTLLCGCLWASPALAQYQVELTFDDALAGTAGPVNNLETETQVQATLVSGAVRSALTEGRYGRAADFPAGQGNVELSGWVPAPDVIAHLWVKARDASTGNLLAQEGVWRVELAQGQLNLRATAADGSPIAMASNLSWPTDGEFHHLTVRISTLNATPSFTLTIDFAAEEKLDLPGRLGFSNAMLRVGGGFDGLIDELIIANRPSATITFEDDRFNRWPEDCPANTTCFEEAFTLVPRDFSHEVPVRFKTVYDPARCSAATPCPLLFSISGGSACANDYETATTVGALAAEGFVVVTIDPYCEGHGNTTVPGSEVGQFIAVKDFVQQQGRARTLIADSDFFATGCSHGAEAVVLWALEAEDYPARTFARSAGGSGLCAMAAEKICSKPGGIAALPFDINDPRTQEMHERGSFVDALDAPIVNTRDIARSWGANLEGPVCDGEKPLCTEEGQWGMTYASRRFRDVWERLQPADEPTGYFVEDRGADCRHCAPVGSEAFRCGVCLLQWGRKEMAANCPACLSYEDASIDRGLPAESCPIPAAWYQDPLVSTPDAGADGASPLSDGGVTTGDGPSKSGSSGCRMGGGEGGAAGELALLLMLGLAGLLRRRLAVS